jgi:hypothetical protein
VSFVDVVTVVTLVLIAVAAFDVAINLRAIRRLLERYFFGGPDSSWWARATSPNPVGSPPPYFNPLDQGGPTSSDGAARPRTGGHSGSDKPRHAADGDGGPSSSGSSTGDGESERGFCVWSFRGGKWEILQRSCREGYVPGPPPARAGEYEGQCVRRLCVKAE